MVTIALQPSKIERSTLAWTGLLLVFAAIFAAELAYAYSEGYWWVALLGLWPLLSVVTVTSFYALASVSSPLGVRLMSGDLWPAIQPLLWPFQWVARALTHAKRSILGEQTRPSHVLPKLWLGMHPSAAELRILEAQGVVHIVDLCAELPANPRVLLPPYQRLHVPALDRCPPSAQQLAEATTWALDRMNEGHSVYVHCAFGRGRSAMMCAAIVLVLKQAQGAQEAMALVRKARPGVSLKSAQWRALERFASGLDVQRSGGDLLPK